MASTTDLTMPFTGLRKLFTTRRHKVFPSYLPGLRAAKSKLRAYTYDRESANYSRDAFEQLLEMLAANPNVKEINIVAHSMGNWVTLEALRGLSIRSGKIGKPRSKTSYWSRQTSTSTCSVPKCKEWANPDRDFFSSCLRTTMRSIFQRTYGAVSSVSVRSIQRRSRIKVNWRRSISRSLI